MNRFLGIVTFTCAGLAPQKYLILYQYFNALVVIVTRFLISILHAVETLLRGKSKAARIDST